MNELKTLIKISRPRFWLYLAGPYLLGFAISAGSQIDLLNIKFFLPLLFFLLPANIILYGVNDIFDRSTDKLNPKKEDKENFLKRGQFKLLKYSIVLSLIFSVPLFLFTTNFTHLMVFVAFLLLTYFYSAPPLRFKSIAFLDSFSNVLYGLPAVWGYMQNSAYLPPMEIWTILLSWNAAMHLFSAIPDINVDKKAGIQTTAVLLGENRSLIFCTLLWCIFSFTTIHSEYLLPFGFLSLIYPLLPILILIKKDLKTEKIYWYFPYINSFAGFLVFWVVAYKKFL